MFRWNSSLITLSLSVFITSCEEGEMLLTIISMQKDPWTPQSWASDRRGWTASRKSSHIKGKLWWLPPSAWSADWSLYAVKLHCTCSHNYKGLVEKWRRCCWLAARARWWRPSSRPSALTPPPKPQSGKPRNARVLTYEIKLLNGIFSRGFWA